MDLTGRRLGKYELLERVGQGGMAAVYKALQPTIDRYVAVKVLHSHLAEDEKFLERFKREARGLGSLRHPHIVSVIDFDVADGWYYMVMDFIHGETLQQVLNRRGQLPLEEALRLAAQLANALDYAHRHGRIHRDIKPSNVMFADDAQQHPVITDFGLTRLMDNVTITVSGTIAGTPAYMSPEAAQGKTVDARGDIYSLGVMLYELVTGQQPYQGETPLSVIMKLVLEPLPPAQSINPDLPIAVVDILNKATAKSPDERYQTAAEFHEALQTVIGDEGVENGDWRSENGPQVEAATEEGTVILSPDVGLEPVAEAEVAMAAEPERAAPAHAIPAKKGRGLPLFAGFGLLIVALVAGFMFLNGRPEETPEETAVPTTAALVTEAPAGDGATVTAEAPGAVEQTPVPAQEDAPVLAGVLSFAQPLENNSRPYTLSLEGVAAPPAGLHYELWFEIAGQERPESVASITAQEGRINYSDVLVENLATRVTGVLVSLEPDFDDDPTISADVVYSGTADPAAGLAEIVMFDTGP